MNKLVLLAVLLSCPLLFSMESAVQKGAQESQSSVVLALCDDEKVSLKRNFAYSFKTLKKILSDLPDAEEISVNIDSQELALLLRLYTTRGLQTHLLKTYTFEELLMTLRAAEYLDAQKTVRAELTKKISEHLICRNHSPRDEQASILRQSSAFIGRHSAVLSWSGILTMVMLSFYASDTYLESSAWVVGGIMYTMLLSYIKSSNEALNPSQEENLFLKVTLNKEMFKKFSQDLFHDDVKCDVIIYCIQQNKRLCRLIKKLEVSFPKLDALICLESVIIRTGQEPVRLMQMVRSLEKEIQEMYEFIKKCLGEAGMKELAKRIAAHMTGEAEIKMRDHD